MTVPRTIAPRAHGVPGTRTLKRIRHASDNHGVTSGARLMSARMGARFMKNNAVRIGACALILGVGALAGCSSSNSNALSHARRAAARTHGVQISKHGWHDPAKRLTTVNGETPPGIATFAKTQSDAIKANDPHGNIALTHLTVRAPGTRSPVHVHELGGTTCLMQGEMTLYLEGAKPQRAVAGECYYMPGGRAMSGLNSGTADAIMFDSFALPKGSPEWVNLELDEPGHKPKS